MKKFEVGKRYYTDGVDYEIIVKTEKTITFNIIYHGGRFNEKIAATKKVKLRIWPKGEVFITSNHLVEA